MKIKLFTYLFVGAVLSSSLIISCSSSKTCEDELTYHTGTLIVVGNEPFTSLALQVADKETYLLECDEELTGKLWKKQGEIYKIGFCETTKKSRGTVLIVLKAEPVKEKH